MKKTANYNKNKVDNKELERDINDAIRNELEPLIIELALGSGGTIKQKIVCEKAGLKRTIKIKVY